LDGLWPVCCRGATSRACKRLLVARGRRGRGSRARGTRCSRAPGARVGPPRRARAGAAAEWGCAALLWQLGGASAFFVHLRAARGAQVALCSRAPGVGAAQDSCCLRFCAGEKVWLAVCCGMRCGPAEVCFTSKVISCCQQRRMRASVTSNLSCLCAACCKCRRHMALTQCTRPKPGTHSFWCMQPTRCQSVVCSSSACTQAPLHHPVITSQRKAHGQQRAPEILVFVLPRALHDAVTHAQYTCTPLLQQGGDKTRERRARRARGGIRGHER